jgi:uncharacterized membrane protein YfcA
VDKNTTKQDKIMDYIDFFIFFAVSAIGGAINSVAGGGTFLTFPVFILNGLSPLQANVMSTIALCPGSIASAYAYRSQLDIDRALLKQFMLVNLIGSIIGTAILLTLPEVTFERAVPWLLLFATLLFTFGGYAIRWIKKSPEHNAVQSKVASPCNSSSPFTVAILAPARASSCSPCCNYWVLPTSTA